MTNQELFDNAYRGFILEGKPFGFDVSKKRCVYRGPNGERCAIGISIPDDLYDPTMDEGPEVGGEGYSARSLLNTYGDLAEHFNEVDINFALHLQRVHDSAAEGQNVAIFKEFLENVAGEWNLTIPKE